LFGKINSYREKYKDELNETIDKIILNIIEKIKDKLTTKEEKTEPSNFFEPDPIDLTNYDKKTFEKLVKRGEIEKIDEIIKKNPTLDISSYQQVIEELRDISNDTSSSTTNETKSSSSSSFTHSSSTSD